LHGVQILLDNADNLRTLKLYRDPHRWKDSASVVRVDGGSFHSLALTSTGKVHSWGSRSFGQLGRRISSSYTHEPGTIESALAKIVVSFISCAANCSSALDNRGGVWVWGCLQGEGCVSHAKYPRQVKLFDNGRTVHVVKFVVGWTHSVALTRDQDRETKVVTGARAIEKQRRSSTACYAEMELRRSSAADCVDAAKLRRYSVDPLFDASFPRESIAPRVRKRSASSPQRMLDLGGIRRISSSTNTNLDDVYKVSAQATPFDYLFIAAPSADICVEFESIAELAHPNATGRHHCYGSKFLGRNHFLFVAKSRESRTVAVLRMPDVQAKAYKALVFNRYGIFDMVISQAQVLGDDFDLLASPRDLDIKVGQTFFSCINSDHSFLKPAAHILHQQWGR
jgi:hypothetical protein